MSEADAENISIATDPVQIIKKAIDNARPLMRLEKVRVGSVEYQVPAPITQKRSEFDGMYFVRFGVLINMGVKLIPRDVRMYFY